MCGEKLSKQVLGRQLHGSPPRVRGEAYTPAAPSGVVRITPACAGRSDPRREFPAPSKDHPRVCGEKLGIFLMALLRIGSPPRVRGEDRYDGTGGGDHRITPACAGRSLWQTFMDGLDRDHPRVCGEKVRTSPMSTEIYGSPPRVRGEGRFQRPQASFEGITPACAGRRA